MIGESLVILPQQLLPSYLFDQQNKVCQQQLGKKQRLQQQQR